MAALRLIGQGLSARRGERTVFKDVSFTVAAGEALAVTGPNGAGKSTLLHTIAGLDSLDSGTVRIGDVELGSLNDRKLTELRRDKVGFIFRPSTWFRPSLPKRTSFSHCRSPAPSPMGVGSTR